MYMMLPSSPPTRYIAIISFTIESREYVWEVTIDGFRGIYHRGELLYSISCESIRLNFDLRNSPENYSWVHVPLPNIKDRWSEDYTFHHPDVGTNTVKMNRIIWYDHDGDGKLSVGDTILIEKESGVDWQILPGDIINFSGHSEGLDFDSRHIELPNFTENQTYEMVVGETMLVLEGKRYD